jgi:hypothetical protein
MRLEESRQEGRLWQAQAEKAQGRLREACRMAQAYQAKLEDMEQRWQTLCDHHRQALEAL